MSPNQRPHSGGYVMFLVAVVLAILALVLLGAARVQSDLSTNLRRDTDAVRFEALAQTAFARTAFTLLTEPLGPRSVIVGGDREAAVAPTSASMSASGQSLEELRLDGRPYALGIGRAVVTIAVQDEAGLLNINAKDDRALEALLAQSGVTISQARRLAATLGDYVDDDDLLRPQGAEREEYARARQNPPLNDLLTNRWSALSALGWREAFTRGGQAPWRFVSAHGAGREVNVNTAPVEVLAAILGDARLARTIVARREQAPIADALELEGLTGVQTRADGAVLAVRPGDAFRLRATVQVGARTNAIEGELILNGPDADRPFYWRDVVRDWTGGGVESRDDEIQSLPESAALPAP